MIISRDTYSSTGRNGASIVLGGGEGACVLKYDFLLICIQKIGNLCSEFGDLLRNLSKDFGNFNMIVVISVDILVT